MDRFSNERFIHRKLTRESHPITIPHQQTHWIIATIWRLYPNQYCPYELSRYNIGQLIHTTRINNYTDVGLQDAVKRMVTEQTLLNTNGDTWGFCHIAVTNAQEHIIPRSN